MKIEQEKVPLAWHEGKRWLEVRYRARRDYQFGAAALPMQAQYIAIIPSYVADNEGIHELFIHNIVRPFLQDQLDWQESELRKQYPAPVEAEALVPIVPPLYWNKQGARQDLAEMVHELIPVEGECDEPYLEYIRRVSNWYYDVYNNGGCNWEIRLKELVEHPFCLSAFKSVYHDLWQWKTSGYDEDYGYDDSYVNSSEHKELLETELTNALVRWHAIAYGPAVAPAVIVVELDCPLCGHKNVGARFAFGANCVGCKQMIYPFSIQKENSPT